ncbi:MAG: hypothetical protein U0359_15570 [Byssovorax sp.]
MSLRLPLAFSFALPLVAGCGVLPDVTIGAAEGVPPVAGSTAIDIPQDYKCGTPISDPDKKYTVTSSGDQDRCTFVFKQDVEAIKAADYSNMPALQGAQLIRRIDFDVNKLGVTDAATGKALDPTSTLLDLDGKAFDSTIFTKDDLSKTPPYTKSVEGAAVDALKDKVQAKQDIVIPVEVTVVVKLSPTPPAKIGLDFDAQPNLVLGF